MNTRSDIINYCISKFGFKDYLEIGVSIGVNIQSINVQNKDGVDPGVGNYSELTPLVNYKMTSDDFFEKIKDTEKKYDFIFIDGLHETDQVDKDINNAFKHLRENGIIMLHDTVPSSFEAQIVPRTQRRWNGDVWKSVVKIRFNNPNCTVMTLDLDEGCTLIKRGNQVLYNETSLDEALKYSYFEQNKVKLLNIVSADYMKENI